MRIWYQKSASLLCGVLCPLCVAFSCSGLVVGEEAADVKPIRVLILDGQNNHQWEVTTPLMKKHLEASGRFDVDVATSPAQGEDMRGFRPAFADYDVVLSNYNGERWSAATEEDFLKFVRGGGFVCVHAANNAFADWPEYNTICGIGGWGGRDGNWGPYIYFRDDGDELVRDDSAGAGGHHGPQHEFQVRIRDDQHPITRGLPPLWMHTKDELYERLRGPAENLHVLATAYADPSQGGSGRHEPMLMTLEYGRGRVFHTVLGHADYSMNCVGFITTLLRGTEWAATGDVTIPVPDDFPTADEARSRE